MTQRWRVNLFGLLAGLWMVGLIAAGILYRKYYITHYPEQANPANPPAWTPARPNTGPQPLPFPDEEVPEKRVTNPPAT
ncbi:MAG: hypothetical protein U1D30_17085 [Planctomycetota bacterium]